MRIGLGLRHPLDHSLGARGFVRPQMEPVSQAEFAGQPLDGLQGSQGIILPSFTGGKDLCLELAAEGLRMGFNTSDLLGGA